MQRKQKKSLKEQIKSNSTKPIQEPEEYEGDTQQMTSTGSTLLDLAISGGRIRGGGLTGGILVEIFGPHSSGKTVLLSEIIGNVQRGGGESHYGDPEGRWDKDFAKLFIDDIESVKYSRPQRVPEVFKGIREAKPKNPDVVNGWAEDSLAALSTDLEMDSKEGDKMGMRRAKEFSEELRKTCLIITEKNYLVVASNQIRQTGNTFGPQYKSPGGESIGFYASVRLRLGNPKQIKDTRETRGKEVERVIGIQTNVEVYKNSTWEPFRIAPVYIYYKYGIDDIHANLQFIKDYTEHNSYTLEGKSLSNSSKTATRKIEKDNLEEQLKKETIDLWEEIESKFKTKRKPKHR